MADDSDTVPGDAPDTSSRRDRREAVLGVINIVIMIVLGLIVVSTLLPLGGHPPEAWYRTQCKDNLKQIGLALHNYADRYGGLPPAYTTDADGKPLHSWRTLILPDLDEQALYNKIDLSKPWSDPVNAEARQATPRVFRCPSSKAPANSTTYLGVVAPNGCFQPTERRKLSDITDQHDGTLMVIEVPQNLAVHWMAPIDARETLIMGFGPRSRFSHDYRTNPHGTHVLTVNGLPRFVPADLSPAKRRALISISGNEELGDW